MATTNIEVTSSWVKLADVTDTELLVTWSTPVTIEVATTSANTAPTVNGHRLSNSDAITRGVIGSGYVWAKLVSGAFPPAAPVVVTK